MKKYLQIFSLLLVLVLLGGCANQETDAAAAGKADVTTAPPSETTEPPVQINTEETLRTALEDDGRVTLEGDIVLTQAVQVSNNLLDGAGFTVTAPVYNEEDTNTSCAIFLSKGSVENITVTGGYRGFGTDKEHRATGDIRLTKVTADGENSALYVGNGDVSGMLLVKDSRFAGRTVFNRIKEAQFDNCDFSWNASGSAGNITAYTDTMLVNCRFESKEDGTKFILQFPGSVENCTMTLENCYVGDTLITEDNIGSLLTVKPRKNTIQVHNVG